MSGDKGTGQGVSCPYQTPSHHSHPTIALTNGVPVKIVSERLGHANVSITLETYAHVLDRADAEATEQAATAILGDRS